MPMQESYQRIPPHLKNLSAIHSYYIKEEIMLEIAKLLAWE
jgi:hypothetical protein